MRIFIAPALAALLIACHAHAESYQVRYEVEVDPAAGMADVAVTLEGDELPSKLAIHFNPGRHSDFQSSAGDQADLEIDEDVATWRPKGSPAQIQYRFRIDNERDNGAYDSRITEDWAILRSDKLIPPIAVTAPKNLESRAELDFDLPEGWSSAAPYKALNNAGSRYEITDPGRRFVRPKGWLILGAIASRQDVIADIDVRVAAPRGQDIRLQDALAFINWTLPHLREIFPDFPPQILIVSGDDPMWRGGLSGPNSLFMHGDRPLISGNRTSSLVHELVHVGTSISGTEYSDWIVEGIAEYYAAEILHRSGGISDFRYQETLDELAAWAEDAGELFTGRSTGPTTAKAVGIMYRVDREIRERTDGESSLDDVATALAKEGGKISVADFVETAESIAGGELKALSKIKSSMP